MCVHHGKTVELLIKVNGSKIIGRVLYTNERNSVEDCVSGAEVATLSVGDHISVVGSGSTSAGDVLASADSYSHFHGFLI